MFHTNYHSFLFLTTATTKTQGVFQNLDSNENKIQFSPKKGQIDDYFKKKQTLFVRPRPNVLRKPNISKASVTRMPSATITSTRTTEKSKKTLGMKLPKMKPIMKTMPNSQTRIDSYFSAGSNFPWRGSREKFSFDPPKEFAKDQQKPNQNGTLN